MKEMYELEQRLNNTGREGCVPLTDEDLIKLKNYYDECCWYFEKTGNRMAEFWFMTNRQAIKSCLLARGLRYD